MDLPRITVITINLNNINGLEKTFQSVKSQNYLNLEFMIFDGGSRDESLKFLKSHSTEISYWVSEKDSGVYDAMNKGIKHASGDYLLFLNSGDHFFNEEAISSLVKNSSGEDLIYGQLKVVGSDSEWIKTYPSILNFRYFYFESLPHPATLISRKLMVKMGGYDIQLKIASDWKFFLLAVAKYGCSYRLVDKVISVFYLDGLSSQPANQKNLDEERVETMKVYFPWYYRAYKTYLQLLGKDRNS